MSCDQQYQAWQAAQQEVLAAIGGRNAASAKVDESQAQLDADKSTLADAQTDVANKAEAANTAYQAWLNCQTSK